MNTVEYQNALDLGLGRAVQHLRNHDGHPYREIILDACLHNKAYDPQVEGSRARYMLDILLSSGEASFYADRVIGSLWDEEHDWDTPQRYGITRLLAQGGDNSAREAMYSAFTAKQPYASDIAIEFINLDGIQGLIFVASQIGGRLARNADDWEDDFLLSIAGDVCGEEVAVTALKEAGATDPNVKAYLAAVENNRDLRAKAPRTDPKTMSYDQIRSCIESKRPIGFLAEWAKWASDSDLERAAHDLIKEKDLENLKWFLVLFRKRHFPLEVDHLLKLLELPDGPVPFHALRALANIEDERVRKLAFEVLEMDSRRGWAIDLLARNFRGGDHAVVEGWCDSEHNPGIVNAFDRSLREFFAANPNAEIEVRLLNKMYEKEPCAHCRSYIVERLLKLNSLSERLKSECEVDSYADTRSLVKAR